MIFTIVCVILAFVILYIVEPRIFLVVFQKIVFHKGKRKAAFVDKRLHFPECIVIEKNWKSIRDEFQKIANGYAIPRFHEIDKANNKISFETGPAWRTVLLKAYDGWFEKNCDLFPTTHGLLAGMQNVSTIMFSVLEPGTVIPPHRGKLNGVFRYHLALQVPASDDCYIVVNNEKYKWKEGEGVLFDDTYLHEVRNQTNECRIILFLDIKKRTTLFLEVLNNFFLKLIILSPLFRKGRKKGKINVD